MDQIIDVIRVINTAAASIVFGLVVFRGRLNYDGYNARERVFQNALTLYSLSSAIISAETLARSTDERFSPFLLLAANIYAVRTLISYHKQMFASKTTGV